MSEIKVNKISQRSGTAITLGNSGTDFQLPSGADILAQSGSTITIAAGATITNSGTATGFGATGAVNWDTTAKTTGFTAVSGNGYFVNTTSAEITVNLPSTPSAGNIVAVKDYANTAGTNNIIIGRNGSKISGSSLDYLINTNGNSVTLVYVDSTQGWTVVNDGLASSISPDSDFIIATGGTITTCGDYKIHSFTGPGTFTVSSAGTPVGSTTVDYMVVAGGGGGAGYNLGGGGAGGFRMSTSLPISATGYPISIGAGGTSPGPSSNGTQGVNSIFSSITSTGGGGGGNYPTSGPVVTDGSAGGSGGGIGRDAYLSGRSSSNNGNTPPVSPSQGNNGGVYSYGPGGTCGSSGGGGAAAIGSPGYPGNSGGSGGAGSPATPQFGSAPKPYYQADVPGNGTSAPGYFSGGGGGGGSSGGGSGGIGGGGGGSGTPPVGKSGTANTGGGGGGGQGQGGSGGSGIVLIKYKYQ
jgi:hypothetical protein